MSDKHLDAGLSPDERATALLAQMSLDEKMAQVSCYWPLDINATADFAERYPHGVGQVTCLEVRDARDLEEVVEFQRRVQSAAMAASGHGIPATFHMEGLCGAFLPGATSFPSGLARGSTWDPDLEGQIGSIVGRQERAVGITQTFGPVLDVSRDPRLGREGETYGEDPALVAALGVAFTNGLQEDGSGIRTEAVAKHFLGSHHVEGGIHGAHGDVPERLLREVYAKPFQAAITLAGLRGVMPCYSAIGGEAVSASERILTGLLRDEMGLDGVAVSDYGAIGNLHTVQHVAESLAHAGLRAMSAGMDSELHVPMAFNDELRDWFADGRADVAILDRAVHRLLAAKFRMGLFEHPFATGAASARQSFQQRTNRDVTLRAARESIVLLRNDGVLPLRADIRSIAVVGPHAATARSLFGGYTHFSMSEGKLAARTSMAGLAGGDDPSRAIERRIPGTKIQADDDPAFEEVLQQQQPGIRSLLDELRARLPDVEVLWARGYPIAGSDESGHDEAIGIAARADLVLITIGGKHGTSSIASMGEGIDATHINLPPCQESLIRKLAAFGTPVVGIHLDGRPVSSDAADEHLNGLIEAWSPGESGAQAIVDVLLGVFNPSGRLPVSVARNSGQVPIYYNHPYGSGWHQGESIGFAEYVDAPHTPRYFFGEGLSYTAFEYSGLTLSSRFLPPQGSLVVALTVSNAGAQTGTDVVQLYARDRYASIPRPVLELVGFARVHLGPDESREVRFTLEMSQLAFLDLDMRWRVEAGEVDILVGASSADIRLSDTFRVSDTQLVEGRTRAFYAAAQIGAIQQAPRA